MKLASSGSSLPIYSVDPSSGIQPGKRVPRANPPSVSAIELMGINLHEEREVTRDVDNAEMKQMRIKMG